MSVHLTQNQIEGYRRQKLLPTELLSVSDHLGDCDACRQQVERAFNGDAAFFALQSEVLSEETKNLSSSAQEPHLLFEQMAEYVDGMLAGEELQAVEDHLASCERCDWAVSDLRDFRDQVAPELDREYRPAIVPTVTESWWRSLTAFLPSPLLRSPALAFGSALAMLLLGATGWLIWQTREGQKSKPELATTVSPTPMATPTALFTPTPEVRAATVIAQLNDGEGQVALDREGKLSGADRLPPAYQQIVKDAFATQQLAKSSLLAGLARPGSSLMGSDERGKQFSVTEPVGKVMLSDHPTFRWSPLEGATGYLVEIYDENFNLAVSSSQLVDTSWRAPQPLKRGSIYSWQVKAVKDGQEITAPRPPAPQAKFRILDQAKADELAQARRNYASSHLTLGLLYTQAGLLDEAERELRVLQKANPDSAVVRQWLANVQAMRR